MAKCGARATKYLRAMSGPDAAPAAPPFTRSRVHAAYRTLSRFAPVETVGERPATLRIRRALRQSSLVREPTRYAVAAALGIRGVHPYHVKETGLPVWLRHPGDSWTFEEIFGANAYALPRTIRERLDRKPEVVVADLGANVGLFGTYILGALPQARVVGYEPDPGNAAICRHTVAWAERAGRYRLVQAAAGVRPGIVHFEAGLGGRSHVAQTAATDTITVPVEDVMPL